MSDPGNEIAKAYGLKYDFTPELRAIYEKVFGLKLPRYNGDDSWTLPMPARYLVDREGIIRYAAVNPDHTRRPEPALTIAALKSLEEI